MALYRGYYRLDKLSKILNKYTTKQQDTWRNSITQLNSHPFHTSNYQSKRRKTAEEKKSPRIIEYSPKPKAEVIEVWRNITIAELAKLLNRDTKYISDLFLNEISGERTVITDLGKLQDAIRRSGRRMRVISKQIESTNEEEDVYPQKPPAKSALVPRPPVVTIMGHVDHGKTTLLDALRRTSVVDEEFGGITQHIGAFSAVLQSGTITFLDTPGHAAFTAMRERGANITDIVVLVIAADDGVMEQTVESIRMARSAAVPILVAINKIDAPNADVERAEQQLMQVGIQVERHGGDVQAIPISARNKQNLGQLIEALLVQAELLEIGGDPTGLVEAVVVESKMDKHRGKLSTVVVQRGTLKRGDILVADTAMCKVRLLRSADGARVDSATPGYPVEVEGWRELPAAGDVVLQVPSEQKARAVVKVREHKKRAAEAGDIATVIAAKEEDHHRIYSEQLALKRRMGRRRKLKPTGPRQKEIADDDGEPTLNVLIKADVNGTLEAILNTLDTYDCPECALDLVHYGVGAVTESDVELAKPFEGIIYAFNVECATHVVDAARSEHVQIRPHNVIYKLVDDVKEELSSRLPPKEVEEVIGEAAILQQFDINEGKKKVAVAGSRCVKGVLKRGAFYRLVRNQEVLFEGTLTSMRHLKNEVDTIKKDLECGLQVSDKSVTFQPGDTLVCFEKRLEPQRTTWDPGF